MGSGALCSQRGDSRTGLEAEAYVAWMTGVLEMERARDWQAAVASLQRSKCVFGGWLGSANQPLTTIRSTCVARMRPYDGICMHRPECVPCDYFSLVVCAHCSIPS